MFGNQIFLEQKELIVTSCIALISSFLSSWSFSFYFKVSLECHRKEIISIHAQAFSFFLFSHFLVYCFRFVFSPASSGTVKDNEGNTYEFSVCSDLKNMTKVSLAQTNKSPSIPLGYNNRTLVSSDSEYCGVCDCFPDLHQKLLHFCI